MGVCVCVYVDISGSPNYSGVNIYSISTNNIDFVFTNSLNH